MKPESAPESALNGQNELRVKERPILFSGPMVRAILDGRKTQTRRIVKHEIRGPNPPGPRIYDHYIKGKWEGAHVGGDPKSNALALCPYGVAGGRLWVKEGLKRCGKWAFYDMDGTAVQIGNHDQKWHWKNAKLPARFMPKDYARITLEITKVRVERLQDIREADAKAEGVEPQRVGYWADGRAGGKKVGGHDSYVESYGELWDSINGKGAWKKNPWVWVIEFKRVLSEHVTESDAASFSPKSLSLEAHG